MRAFPLSASSAQKLGIPKIRMDGGTQTRALIDQPTVADYAESMATGVQFPPVVVFYDGTVYWLADGFHRVHAAIANKQKVIAAEVRQGDKRDAVLFSVGANAAHGLRRTNADKRRAVIALLSDAEWAQWSDRAIARQCSVSDRFVNTLRHELSANGSQIDRKVERGGTTYTQKTANIGSKPAVTPKGGSDPSIYPFPEEVPVVDGELISATHAYSYVHMYRGSTVAECGECGATHSHWKPIKGGYWVCGECGWNVIDDEMNLVTKEEYEARNRRRPTSLGNASMTHQPLAQHLSKTVEHYTPPIYIEAARQVMGGIDFDPASCARANAIVQAAQYFTVDDDGLSKPWSGRTWMNPPYGRGENNESNQGIWTRRLIHQHKAGNVPQAIALVNAVPAAQWFKPLWNYLICFTDHRIEFISEDGEIQKDPPHGNAFIYFGQYAERFGEIFSQFGTVVWSVYMRPEETLDEQS